MLATAKIHILKQFTTSFKADHFLVKLCLPLQRYTFWSNSQHIIRTFFFKINCACHCKDTHFEAIHNLLLFVMLSRVIVLATAKIHILKQFTTKKYEMYNKSILCLPLQRYTFWSNSQHVSRCAPAFDDCACHCKDTHFEAIHNEQDTGVSELAIVLATAKIHILKQFTTTTPYVTRISPLCLPLQRYTFWSNSQLQVSRLIIRQNCACHCKDTHFEAIHNYQLPLIIQA